VGAIVGSIGGLLIIVLLIIGIFLYFKYRKVNTQVKESHILENQVSRMSMDTRSRKSFQSDRLSTCSETLMNTNLGNFFFLSFFLF